MVTNSTAPLSEFHKQLSQEKSTSLRCNSLGEMNSRVAIALFRLTVGQGGGTVNCLHFPGLTWFDILLIWMTS